MRKAKSVCSKVFKDVRSWRRKLSRRETALFYTLPSRSTAPSGCTDFVPSQEELELDTRRSAVRARLLWHGDEVLFPTLVISVGINPPVVSAVFSEGSTPPLHRRSDGVT